MGRRSSTRSDGASTDVLGNPVSKTASAQSEVDGRTPGRWDRGGTGQRPPERRGGGRRHTCHDHPGRGMRTTARVGRGDGEVACSGSAVRRGSRSFRKLGEGQGGDSPRRSRARKLALQKRKQTNAKPSVEQARRKSLHRARWHRHGGIAQPDGRFRLDGGPLRLTEWALALQREVRVGSREQRRRSRRVSAPTQDGVAQTEQERRRALLRTPRLSGAEHHSRGKQDVAGALGAGTNHVQSASSSSTAISAFVRASTIMLGRSQESAEELE